jgi:hypothetical protein
MAHVTGGMPHGPNQGRGQAPSATFDAAQCTLTGIELMHMLKKGQLALEESAESLTPAA